MEGDRFKIHRSNVKMAFEVELGEINVNVHDINSIALSRMLMEMVASHGEISVDGTESTVCGDFIIIDFNNHADINTNNLCVIERCIRAEILRVREKMISDAVDEGRTACQAGEDLYTDNPYAGLTDDSELRKAWAVGFTDCRDKNHGRASWRTTNIAEE